MLRRRHCSRQQLVVHNSLAFCEQRILRIAQKRTMLFSASSEAVPPVYELASKQ